ncbi:hypothetical protein T01_10557 [Trichinella spiralis]|uniref:Uncharacterized protein n=1 Tax=Trichinella spiralis TaxID=6334 RepID=A0A0V1BI30_TRISP|nr:hypothetical protein T01_10557 [Trichinella spiralis]
MKVSNKIYCNLRCGCFPSCPPWLPLRLMWCEPVGKHRQFCQMQCLKRHEGRADITSGAGGEMLCRRYRRRMSSYNGLSSLSSSLVSSQDAPQVQ